MNVRQIIACLLGFFSLGTALECYVCQNQPDNRDKCVKTTIQCREEQNTCRTRIQWRQPTFWTPRSNRMYYLDKSCDVDESCQREQTNKGLKCMRDWYQDWDCIECCQGDRCNYYATLGSASISSSMMVVTVAVTVQIFHWFSNR